MGEVGSVVGAGGVGVGDDLGHGMSFLPGEIGPISKIGPI